MEYIRWSPAQTPAKQMALFVPDSHFKNKISFLINKYLLLNEIKNG
jgi:hypothetical protein